MADAGLIYFNDKFMITYGVYYLVDEDLEY
jgi:hypothetical protein